MKNKEEKEKQGAKTLEKLQSEKLEKVLKALDKADSEPQTSNNTNNEQPISSKTKPKTTDPKVSVNVTITTDKSEKKQVNGTTSPIMQKMLKAKNRCINDHCQFFLRWLTPYKYTDEVVVKRTKKRDKKRY